MKMKGSTVSNESKVLDSDGDESDEEQDEARVENKKERKKTAQEYRKGKVLSTIEELTEKQGTLFTPMQFRIWSESVVGGIHSSLEEPPTSSRFVRAGKGTSSKKNREI